MSFIIFVIILAVLIFVHELGHFLVAKKSGIKVSEFGLGFPPKLFGKKYGETEYTLNAIPFGGFVKIFGETPDDESISGPEKERSFVNKPRYIQALVLVAGVTFNVIFAWLLISIGFMSGLPSSIGAIPGQEVKNARVVVTEVLKDYPAEKGGLKAGDSLKLLVSGADTLENFSVEGVQNFIASHNASPLEVHYVRGSNEETVTVVPQINEQVGRHVIGISMDMIGVLKLPPHIALVEGAKLTGSLIKATTIGLATFIVNAFTFRADFSQVTGPVGIVSLVGGASDLGFIYLLSFTAFISINLAVINLIPFPALDGGRLLFVLVEAIRRKPLNPKVINAVNGVGFALLILLMLVVTIHDIFKLV